MQTFENTPTCTIALDDMHIVYRDLGPRGGVPVIFFHHLTAVLDDWDPQFVDGVAARHHVIVFDNRGVGASSGMTPSSIQEMATDAIAFIDALGFAQVDVFGFSLGGFVAQALVHARPGLVRRVVLAGTGPAGGVGISNVGTVLQHAISATSGTARHPKHLLFFTQSRDGQAAADHYLRRLSVRVADRDTAVSDQTIEAQLSAIQAWGDGPPTPIETFTHPVLVANGDDDVMVPSLLSPDLARRIPGARLSIFPNAGHGAVFEHRAAFVPQMLAFLAA